MSEWYLTFEEPVIARILRGVKTQQRVEYNSDDPGIKVGELIWVAEDFFEADGHVYCRHRNDLYPGNAPTIWRSAHEMRREQSQLTLVVTDRYLQRVWDMSLLDLRAEGVNPVQYDIVYGNVPDRDAGMISMAKEWNARGGAPFNANPLALVLEFVPVRRNIADVINKLEDRSLKREE